MNPKHAPQEVISEVWTQKWDDHHWGQVDIVWCGIFILLVMAIMYWFYIIYQPIT